MNNFLFAEANRELENLSRRERENLRQRVGGTVSTCVKQAFSLTGRRFASLGPCAVPPWEPFVVNGTVLRLGISLESSKMVKLPHNSALQLHFGPRDIGNER
jgi:hypothetical protein